MTEEEFKEILVRRYLIIEDADPELLLEAGLIYKIPLQTISNHRWLLSLSIEYILFSDQDPEVKNQYLNCIFSDTMLFYKEAIPSSYLKEYLDYKKTLNISLFTYLYETLFKNLPFDEKTLHG